MHPVIYFDSIHISTSFDRIYSRLGYNKEKTLIDPERKQEVDQYIDEAIMLADLKGAAKCVPVEKNDGEKIVLSGDIIFESRTVAELLKDCSEILIMGATAGERITRSILRNSKGNFTRGVVLDAVASEMVDDCLPWMMNYFNNQLRRQNKQLTKKRLSAGYGDFNLRNQKKIFSLLNLKKLGISLNESSIFIPEKSVTAVTGIKSIR